MASTIHVLLAIAIYIQQKVIIGRQSVQMSKKSSFFREMPPPQLSKLLTVSQPQKQLISEHWKHLFCATQLQIVQGSKSVIVVYKSSTFLTMVCFQQSCLTYQRKFKIIYSQLYEITSLKIQSVVLKHKDIRKRELVVLIGFYDGTVELYHLIVTDKTVVLKKYLAFQSTPKQPVTNMITYRGSLIVSRLHQAQIYNDAVTTLVDLIVQEEYAKQSKSSSNQINCKVSNFALKDMGEGMAISIAQGKQCVHVFNESEGSKTFLLQTLQEYGSITDSICFMLQLVSENLVIGDTNDKLKIIYKKRNIVERFRGFKNYCTDGCHLLFHTHQELWVADYHGCVSYFTRGLVEDNGEKATGLRVVDKEVHFSSKVCEFGIKKMSICGKIMIILDSQSNIHFLDIIRNQSNLNPKDLHIESVNEQQDED